MIKKCRSSSEFLEILAKSPVVIDQWQLEKLALVAQKAEILFYTPGLPADYHEWLWGKVYRSSGEALGALTASLKPGATIALIPEGPYVLAKAA
jgi:lactate racemase